MYIYIERERQRERERERFLLSTFTIPLFFAVAVLFKISYTNNFPFFIKPKTVT